MNLFGNKAVTPAGSESINKILKELKGLIESNTTDINLIKATLTAIGQSFSTAELEADSGEFSTLQAPDISSIDIFSQNFTAVFNGEDEQDRIIPAPGSVVVLTDAETVSAWLLFAYTDGDSWIAIAKSGASKNFVWDDTGIYLSDYSKLLYCCYGQPCGFDGIQGTVTEQFTTGVYVKGQHGMTADKIIVREPENGESGNLIFTDGAGEEEIVKGPAYNSDLNSITADLDGTAATADKTAHALTITDATQTAHNFDGSESVSIDSVEKSLKATQDADGNVISTSYIKSNTKGVANGVCSLDASGKVPASMLPSSIMEYKGNWNASTNTPTLADGTGTSGDTYKVSVAGTVDLGSGPITFYVGDWVMYNGSIWERSANTNLVSSVNGMQGQVELTGDNVPYDETQTLNEKIQSIISGANENLTITKSDGTTVSYNGSAAVSIDGVQKAAMLTGSTWFRVADNTETHVGGVKSYDGTQNVTLRLPATIKADIEGSATTAGSAETAVSATTAETAGSATTAGTADVSKTVQTIIVNDGTGTGYVPGTLYNGMKLQFYFKNDTYFSSSSGFFKFKVGNSETVYTPRMYNAGGTSVVTIPLHYFKHRGESTSRYWLCQKGTTIECVYDGSNFMVCGNPELLSYHTTDNSYSVYCGGKIEQHGKLTYTGTGDTACSVTYPVPFSNTYYYLGLTRTYTANGTAVVSGDITVLESKRLTTGFAARGYNPPAYWYAIGY